MRHGTVALSGALLASMAFATPAAADFTVLADITKTKDIVVVEEITIRKDIRVNATVTPEIDSAADALAIVNQVIEGNNITDLFDVDYSASITGSIGILTNGNSGITAVNQDVGNVNNQANTGAFAITDDGDAFTNAEVSVEQVNGAIVGPDGVPIGDPNTLVLFGHSFSASITDSINNNTGITHVNQNAGNLNNQANALAVAAGIGCSTCVEPEIQGFAIAEADLGQQTSGQTLTGLSPGGTQSVTMVASVINNHGVVGVNQAAGNFAAQANLVALSASIMNQ